MKEHISLVEKAHEMIGARLCPGDSAVDATVGNGHDTLFLLRRIVPGGKVYGFDVQLSALASAEAKINDPALRACLTLFNDSHARMLTRIPKPAHGVIAAVMFNLGYLPGGDKAVTTRTDSTLAALAAASQVLSPHGIITIVAYPGHAGGAQETEQVGHWCENLDPGRFTVERIRAKSNDPAAPRLFVVTRGGPE